MTFRKFDCERPAPSLCLMGLSEAELSALAREGIQLKEKKMFDPKWEGFVRHCLSAVGAAMLAMGWADEAMAKEIVGAGLTLVGFVWSWMSK